MTSSKKTRVAHYRFPKPITIADIDRNAEKRIALVSKEFRCGFDFIKKYPKSVTIFGSSMITEADPYYRKAVRFGAAVAKIGYAVVTGGGPGIMEAANRGAFKAGGASVGLNIKLPHEQRPNRYLTDAIEFHYLFSRKVMLSFAAEAYVFFPGGYGTLDEFFEIITLVQTNRIHMPIPLILFGKSFWQPMDKIIKKVLLEKNHTIGRNDAKLYCIEDDTAKILRIIQSAPIVETIPFKH